MIRELLDDSSQIVRYSGVFLCSQGHVKLRVEDRRGVSEDTSSEQIILKDLEDLIDFFNWLLSSESI